MDIEALEREMNEAHRQVVEVETRIKAVASALLTAFDNNPGQNWDKFRKANATLQVLYREYHHAASVWTRKYDNWRKAYNKSLREAHPEGKLGGQRRG